LARLRSFRKRSWKTKIHSRFFNNRLSLVPYTDWTNSRPLKSMTSTKSTFAVVPYCLPLD
jgi:hypothetical protein